jgi:hypothetical protein
MQQKQNALGVMSFPKKTHMCTTVGDNAKRVGLSATEILGLTN